MVILALRTLESCHVLASPFVPSAGLVSLALRGAHELLLLSGRALREGTARRGGCRLHPAGGRGEASSRYLVNLPSRLRGGVIDEADVEPGGDLFKRGNGCRVD